MLDPITISCIVSVVSGSASFGGAFLLLKKYVAKLQMQLDAAMVHTSDHANSLELHINQIESGLKDDINKHFSRHKEVIDNHFNHQADIVQQHALGHQEQLDKTLAVVKAHAQQIIDNSGQAVSTSRLPRATCNTCEKTVYRFDKLEDGTIKCHNCKGH